MRTSKRIIFAVILGAIPMATTGFAFDGAPVNQDSTIPVLTTPSGATVTPKKGVPAPLDTSVSAYATEAVTQWRMGRAYADGNGVAQNDQLAFEYFSRIANQHAEDNPSAPQAAIVANAFVALGHYYLSGIPNSKIAADSTRARDMFGYAATYFGDADAQYELGRIYLGETPSDPHQAARWFQLAATKGQCRAEAALGDMLFKGQSV